jgi:hypothetical protein
MHQTHESKFGRPRGASDSTTATKLIKGADSAISQCSVANAGADKMKEALSKMSPDIAKMFGSIIPNANESLDDARIRTFDAYRGIILGITSSLDKYSREFFQSANEAQLRDVLSHATKLYNAFPQSFPIPSGEKSA